MMEMLRGRVALQGKEAPTGDHCWPLHVDISVDDDDDDDDSRSRSSSSIVARHTHWGT